MQNSEQKHIIKKLSEGDEKTLRMVYTDNKGKFLNYLRRYPLHEDTLQDVYQDAVIALYENAQLGKISDLKSSLSTYLIGIGKYMCLSKLRKEKREVLMDDNSHIKEEAIVEIETDYSTELTLRQRTIKQKIEQLGKKCQEILELFYVENLSTAEIMDVMSYETVNVVKASKSRCLKKLKELVHG